MIAYRIIKREELGYCVQRFVYLTLKCPKKAYFHRKSR